MILITKRRLRKLFERWYAEAKDDNCDDYYYHGASDFFNYLTDRAVGREPSVTRSTTINITVNGTDVDANKIRESIKWAEERAAKVRKAS